jgi:hypothetical protein
MVGGYDNDVDVDMLAGNSDVSKHGCVGLVPEQQPLVKSPTQDEFREAWSEATFTMDRQFCRRQMDAV